MYPHCDLHVASSESCALSPEVALRYEASLLETQLEVRVGRFLAPTQLEYHDRAVALSALFPLPDKISLPRAQKSLLNS